MIIMRLVNRKTRGPEVLEPNQTGAPLDVVRGRNRAPWREMHDRYGLLLRAFFKRFFQPIRISSWQETRLSELNEQGHVIYVMERASILHYLFLNYMCLRLGLPLATYGNGIPSFVLFQPAGKMLRLLWARVSGRLRGEGAPPAHPSTSDSRGLAENQSMVLFLRRYQRFGRKRYTEAKEFLEDLVAFQAHCGRPLYLVPLGILWGKGPQKMQKGVLDIFLGRKDRPGNLRQILVLLRYSRNSILTMGQVIDLKAYRKENIHLEQDLLLKKIRWSLHRELDLARRQITGPSIKPRKYILESILSSRTLREQAREIARSEGKTFEKVMKRAEKYADEIAADYRITYIEFLSLLLTWVWNNIYSGFSVDMKGLERVKTATRKGSVILMPSHRSHLDYLVLSYVFYHNDLPPPHIAAGVNLSFWPLGHIFRRAGAFFIRRTIRGKKLYATVFSTYLRKLLREGYVQEFFLEGTRSRTGKMLQPKLGMLSMELDAFSAGVSEDLQLIPISITYEKIVEESSYTEELGGGRKQKEGFLGLLKTRRFLKKKYGRVYIQFAPPLSIREYLQSKQSDLAQMGGARRQGMVEDLALRVSYAINEVTTVTPSALAATALLNHTKRGITLSELTKNASFLLKLLQELGARRSLVLKNLPWAVEEALQGFVGDKTVQRWDDPDGPIYTLEDNKRIVLDYYKNNILHFFLPFALAGNVFRLYRTDRLPEPRFLGGLGLFMELFSREFLFPREDPVGAYWRVVRHHFVGRRRYMDVEEETIRVRESFPLDYLGRLLTNYFESYYIFLLATERILGSEECEEKEFFNQALRWGDGLYRKGDVSRRESRSSFLFRNALACMISQGCIRKSKAKGGVTLRLDGAGREKFGTYKRTLTQLLFTSE
jgi:glycerol-3-phosphate O-acyltransferase